MNPFYRPTWAEISLDALRHNYEAFRRSLPPSMKLMAVVKANAYGHGAAEIAREVSECGADWLGVAFLDEAIALRRAGIALPILVMGYTPAEGIDLALAHDISLTVYDYKLLGAMHRAGMRGCRVKVHIKVDTGMGRLGLHQEQAAIDFIGKALELPGLSVEGVFTHYATADEADPSYTYEQHRRFQRVIDYFRGKQVSFPCVHAGNSATGIQFPELSYNMLRLGISLYGLYPSDQVDRSKIELTPVMSFKTKVVLAKFLPPGSAVSYGATYRTSGEEQIATLPVGYADGFTRMLTGKAEVLIRGQKVPVVGRICMDQTTINVSALHQVQIGEEVVIFGTQGESSIPADDLARALGTINYEITCMIAKRVPRVYTRQGQICKIVNEIV